MPAGTYTLRALATDDQGATGEATITVTVVASGNVPPVADAGADQAVSDDDLDDAAVVTLDASASSDPDGTISSFVWRDAGGQIAIGVAPDVMLAVGVHDITLEVTDDGALTSTDTVTVTVLFQDDDLDGIPDTWEIGFFAATTVADGATDFDGDGLPDIDEFLAGTDPTDPASPPAAVTGDPDTFGCVPGGASRGVAALLLLGAACVTTAASTRRES
jgi:hypothetical protein